MRLRTAFGSILFLASSVAGADVTSVPGSGWIPEYQQLNLNAGYEYFRTSTNFDDGGNMVDIPSTLVENRFRLGADYGIAQDWALGFKAGFNSAGNGTDAGNGLSDIEASLKWNVKVMDPIITFEVFGRIPAASISAGPNDLVVTDGAVDVGGRIYTGHRAGRLLFSVAPGFTYRSKSYSPQFSVDGLVRFDFLKGYVQGLGSFVYSIDDTAAPFNSAPNKPDALGAGGSFYRLNGAPTGFYLGAGVGVKVYEEWMLEGAFQHAIYGLRYPSFMSVYVGVRTMFDFFKPIKPKRVKEVPFEEDDSRS